MVVFLITLQIITKKENQINLEVFNLPYEIFKQPDIKELTITINEIDLGQGERLESNFMINLTPKNWT